MYFDIVGRIEGIETIATGRAIRDLHSVRRRFGRGKWRKRKGTATIRLVGGQIRRAEIHWYEAHGIGRVKFKIKRFLD